MHPRISVSGLCFPELSATDAIEAIAGLGVASASLTGAKVRESGAGAVVAASRRHGVKIVTTTGLLLKRALKLGRPVKESMARMQPELPRLVRDAIRLVSG